MEFIAGNRITLLESGVAYFPALIAAIDGAINEVHLETYIFENDATGRRVAAALAAAARRGVAVRVLVDGFGARELSRTLAVGLTADDVQVMVFRPERGRLRLRRHRLRRMHRKVAVIDARIAFVGGINVLDDRDSAGDLPPRFDYAARIEGPLIGAVHASVTHLWRVVRWARMRRRERAPPLPLAVDDAVGEVSAALVIRDNFKHRRDIENAYLAAIDAAREEIILANAYFLPGRRFRRALLGARERGVRVLVLLQGRVEYVLFHYATQALCDALLDAGIELFEYHKTYMHAKVAVVDGRWSTVGSSNIDPFSLLVAREANVVIDNAAFAAQLGGSVKAAIADGATQMRRDDRRRHRWPSRVARWLAYTLVRTVVDLTGYGDGERLN